MTNWELQLLDVRTCVDGGWWVWLQLIDLDTRRGIRPQVLLDEDREPQGGLVVDDDFFVPEHMIQPWLIGLYRRHGEALGDDADNGVTVRGSLPEFADQAAGVDATGAQIVAFVERAERSFY